MCFKLNKNLVGLGFQSDFFGTFHFGIQFFEKAQKRRTSIKPEPFVFFFFIFGLNYFFSIGRDLQNMPRLDYFFFNNLLTFWEQLIVPD